MKYFEMIIHDTYVCGGDGEVSNTSAAVAAAEDDDNELFFFIHLLWNILLLCNPSRPSLPVCTFTLH